MLPDPQPNTASVEFLHQGFDERIQCRYLMFAMRVDEFLELVRSAYDAQGAIEGQRSTVRTATAVRIRRTMAKDLEAGAILPPIVLGVVATPAQINQGQWDSASVRALLSDVYTRLTIIDGMQRTSVLVERREALAARRIRLELWLAPSTENLIYRMLILNTGQLPWNLRRQLEVVHRSLLDEIKAGLGPGVSVYRADDGRRRTSAGEYQANDVLEVYMAFSLRKPHVDKDTVLADQFSKLDMIESVSRPHSLPDFIEAMNMLVRFDLLFSRAADREGAPKRLRSGRHIFDRVPACVGFMAAYSQVVFGKVGMDRDAAQRQANGERLRRNCESVLSRHAQDTSEEMHAFLALDTLEEVSERRGGALSIGEAERELYTSAFRMLFESGDELTTMEPCWRSQ